MPDVSTQTASTMEEAREMAAGAAGPALVLAPETLQQIQDAEAAGGFEGGMSGASGDGGFSAPGVAPDSSSASGSAPGAPAPGGGSLGILVEEAAEKALDLKDIWEAFKGDPLGPVILVPTRELQRWLGTGTVDGA
ncbi:hypothetical protein [Phytohabitans houttuyneae]|uniref:Uncharacterized protein n=1 Tax=Phytohabitans houttuyneae TaxID=1076126 RepID=A0A6V8KJ84_9ACTN|nr:hypothetical protein [Phytohabitans houttuyneae]GFJ82501.1 hypothetical protein Phou_066810 [Phytohabitans houttuyneae]